MHAEGKPGDDYYSTCTAELPTRYADVGDPHEVVLSCSVGGNHVVNLRVYPDGGFPYIYEYKFIRL